MSRYAKIGLIGHTHPLFGTTDSKILVDKMISFWKDQFPPALLDKPDLILVPECCDRPKDLQDDKQLLPDYYRFRGKKILELFRETARKNNCYMVYSAVRELEDGSFRNSQTVIGRDGEIAGIYDKAHPVFSEREKGGILCGSGYGLISCDFGTLGCLICFDLNFDDLRELYKSKGPDLLLFSSMYHGGLMQGYWAYSCRSFFAGAIAGPILPSQIRNPFGEIVAATTNYHNTVTAAINLDRCMAHLDKNREKLAEMKRKYGPEVHIHDPGKVGSVMIQSLLEEKTAVEMAREFDIILLDEYFNSCIDFHAQPENIGSPGRWKT
jgi:predicted amidohydrolase